MKVVYLHMHLKPGGVTTVISQQAAAIQDDCSVLVMTGDNPPADFSAPHVRIDGLGYDTPDFPEKDPPPAETADAVASAIRQRWPGGCDLIHVHNPLLAKNSRMLDMLEILKDKGFTLFLQIHDFPEDGRPWAYYKNRPYPADCHYGTINARDSRILAQSGLKPEGIHKLFNMVDPIDTTGVDNAAIPTVLYPVRGIRRKNIGEALLLSLFSPGDIPLAITLPPNSPLDHAVYDKWQGYAKKNRLNVLFEASSHFDFKALVANAHFLITTSITEGFGFAFLEPWTAGKMLTGRKLPDICTDFEAKGINLDHLYDHLFVPMGWLDRDDLEKRWKRCVQSAFGRYGAEIDESFLANGFEQITRNGRIDFSMLSEPFQQGVMDRLINNANDRDEFKKINPVLSQFGNFDAFNQEIESNRKTVSRRFNQNAYRDALIAAYGNVVSTPVKHEIDRRMLLRQFLRPENFSLMKWCDDEL